MRAVLETTVDFYIIENLFASSKTKFALCNQNGYLREGKIIFLTGFYISPILVTNNLDTRVRIFTQRKEKRLIYGKIYFTY